MAEAESPASVSLAMFKDSISEALIREASSRPDCQRSSKEILVGRAPVGHIDENLGIEQKREVKYVSVHSVSEVSTQGFVRVTFHGVTTSTNKQYEFRYEFEARNLTEFLLNVVLRNG